MNQYGTLIIYTVAIASLAGSRPDTRGLTPSDAYLKELAHAFRLAILIGKLNIQGIDIANEGLNQRRHGRKRLGSKSPE